MSTDELIPEKPENMIKEGRTVPRKGHTQKRDVLADPIYNNKVVTKLINNIMLDGKKGVAQKIVYGAFERVEAKAEKPAIEVFEEAMNNMMPVLEVKARMKAILRRNNKPEKEQAKSNVLNIGDMRIDCDSRSLYIAGREINLTSREFDILELLVKNPGKVYSRDNLLKKVWGEEYPGDARTVDVHVRRLREKIESNPSEPKYVHTRWGVGYYYNA